MKCFRQDYIDIGVHMYVPPGLVRVNSKNCDGVFFPMLHEIFFCLILTL